MKRNYGSVLLAAALLSACSTSYADDAQAKSSLLLEGNSEVFECEVTGPRDAQAIVLLHGWPQTLEEWDTVAPTLASEYRVFACNLPGVGRSTNADGDFTKVDMARDIHAALSRGGIGPVHLVGHDIGLMVAYAYASDYPENVDTLTLIDAPIPGTETYARTAEQAWHFDFHMVPEVPEMVVGDSVSAYVRHFIKEYGKATEEELERLMRVSETAYEDPETLRAGFEWYRAMPQDVKDNKARFATKLRMPVLGISSGLAPNAYVAEMLGPLAINVESEHFTDSGHWIPEEASNRTANAILRHIEADR